MLDKELYKKIAQEIHSDESPGGLMLKKAYHYHPKVDEY
ncbi:hypothetical protein BD809_104153 [Aquimarina intermedia]|uniref:Uncharacterized protein n=1 Tax=Aquimarina intermedia TaxID=350814 RepID=A0A5S5C8L8_9FLAO|nr:hypothetical protein BD809_104153 [Aquimarina intermedia]